MIRRNQKTSHTKITSIYILPCLASVIKDVGVLIDGLIGVPGAVITSQLGRFESISMAPI